MSNTSITPDSSSPVHASSTTPFAGVGRATRAASPPGDGSGTSAAVAQPIPSAPIRPHPGTASSGEVPASVTTSAGRLQNIGLTARSVAPGVTPEVGPERFPNQSLHERTGVPTPDHTRPKFEFP